MENKFKTLYTFQFGVFKFPAGVNNGDTLYFQPVATKKNDLKMVGGELTFLRPCGSKRASSSERARCCWSAKMGSMSH